ncbi:hypothetical protein PF003_g33753 [Phytophthora fragariae]|nr:hypothetical protein PF003_g33753 [Phytophthora fragariae]
MGLVGGWQRGAVVLSIRVVAGDGCVAVEAVGGRQRTSCVGCLGRPGHDRHGQHAYRPAGSANINRGDGVAASAGGAALLGVCAGGGVVGVLGGRGCGRGSSRRLGGVGAASAARPSPAGRPGGEAGSEGA